MATNNMNSLTTLIKRLEAATSRLEDIATATNDPSASTNGVSTGPSMMGVPTAAGQTVPNAVSRPPVAATPPASIVDFDALISGDVQSFVKLSEKIGGPAQAFLRSFEAERKFLVITTKAKRPDIQAPIYMEILKDLQGAIGAVSDILQANRGSPIQNQLTTVSEGVSMLRWITVEPKPAGFVTDTLEVTQFFGNRVLKEFKDKDHTHVEWIQAFYRIFKSLSTYIKQHHPSGVVWNNREGIDPSEALRQVSSSSGSSSAPSGGIPPPPPLPTFDDAGPPPLSMPPTTATSAKGQPADMNAVFDQLSKGSAVTAGLRKVDPSQMTHKNPSIRASSTVPLTRSDSNSSLSTPNGRGKSPVPGKRPKPESMRTKKPARKVLEGNKWLLENFDSPPERMITVEASISHSILITKCTKTTIRIVGKANAISIDSSSAVSLVIDSLVSSVDVIKTPKFEMQVLGTLPTIMLDQVDGASLYLSKETAGITEVFTSKCSAVNINVPPAEEDDDYRECAVPEQIKSVIRNGGVVSEIVEHAG